MIPSSNQDDLVAILIRHVAYNTWTPPYNILEAGRYQALEVSADLIKHNFYPDLVLHAPAKRVTQTARTIGVEFRNAGHRLLVRASAALEEFQITSPGIMDEISRLPNNMRCVAAVAHTEGLTSTLRRLSPSSDFTFKFGAAVVLRLPISNWSELSEVKRAEVLHAYIPTGKGCFPVAAPA